MNYYYVIASLSDLTLEEPLPKIDVSEALDFIRRNLVDEDYLLSNYILYTIDNQNLMNQILRDYYRIQTPSFITPSIFDEEEIAFTLKSKHDRPRYMQSFLDNYKEQFGQLRPGVVEEHLWNEFTREISTLGNAFLEDYFQFDKDLRRLASTRSVHLLEKVIQMRVPNNLLFKQLGFGKSIPRLSQQYPYIEKLYGALDSGDPVNIEKTMNSIRWEFMDNYEPSEVFSSTRLFSWMIKLLNYNRWVNLSEAKGKERIEEFCNKVIEASGMPELHLV